MSLERAPEEPGPGRRFAREPLSVEQYETLLGLARSLVSELDLEAVLRQVLTAARDLTDARYAALGILDEEKRGLERFVYIGIDEKTREQIGELPRGRGILGELIQNPAPLRLAQVSSHPRSFGFPPGHPAMDTFLGVPVLIRGEAWGNLYLTEKAGGTEFTDADERLTTLLSQWAAIAIENARLYRQVEERGRDLERLVRALEAGADLSRAVARGVPHPQLLEMIAKRARDLLTARTTAVILSSDGRATVEAAAGEGVAHLVGSEIGLERPLYADALQTSGVTAHTARQGGSLALPELDLECSQLLLAPIELSGRRGMLVVVDRLDGLSFGQDDKLALASFAANAAGTLITADAVEADRLRRAIHAADSERARWARELHDETLQELGALKLMLDAGAARNDAGTLGAAAEQTVRGLDHAIRNLQGLIAELRPAALDELGVGPALESLAERIAGASRVEVELDLRLQSVRERPGGRLAPELEGAIYRLVQESLNNAIKHAEPNKISVTVSEEEDRIRILIRDDGRGFDPDSVEHGFGLVGMHERVRLEDGSLRLDSAPGKGTEVAAELPVRRRPDLG